THHRIYYTNPPSRTRQHPIATEIDTHGDSAVLAAHRKHVPAEPGFGKEASQGCRDGECDGRLTAGEPELGGRKAPFRPGPEYVQAVGQSGPLATERQFESFGDDPAEGGRPE